VAALLVGENSLNVVRSGVPVVTTEQRSADGSIRVRAQLYPIIIDLGACSGAGSINPDIGLL
jgi:hypothetical protein